MTRALYERRVEPLAKGWRSFAWSTGIFDTARRPYTASVEGMIHTPQHVVMATLRGHAGRLEVTSSCGHRYVGADRAGAVSFVPAHCERRLRLSDVAFEWGSIALCETLFDRDEGVGGVLDRAAFTNVDDAFMAGMVGEFVRLSADSGTIDPTYCDAMSWALAHYMVRRYGEPPHSLAATSWKLSPRRLRQITEYVDAHLAAPIRIAELARIADISPGYFHRAFRMTIGKTPLEFINERRVQCAIQLLHHGDALSLAAVALRVGFASPSHFTRTFRKVAGVNPSAFRRVPG